VSVLQLRGDREFYGGYSELTISMFVRVRIDGLAKARKKKTDFENLHSFWDTLNRVRKICNVRHAWTLKKLVRRVKEFTRATTMKQCSINGSQWGNVLKNLDFWTY